jgi:DNA polymerase III delta subunit
MEIKIKDLKQNIIKKNISDDFLVFIYSDNSFLSSQYIDEIVSIKNKEKLYIESLEEVSLNPFKMNDNYLYIIHTEVFESNITNFLPYKNVIVVCKSISEKTRPNLISTGNHVKMPELKDWQVIQYIKGKVPSIPDTQIKWIYNTAGGDIYKIHNEILKLSLFEGNKQLDVFKLMFNEGIYRDLGLIDRFSLKDAILQKDITTISKILKARNDIIIEPMELVYSLSESIKKIIYVNLDKKYTYSDLKISKNYYKLIEENYGNIKSKSLVRMFEFITSIDYKLKSGLLQMSDDSLVDYIVINMLNFLLLA